MNNQENGFWECSGDENNRHILQVMSPDENECRECGIKKPHQRRQQKSQTDSTKNYSYSTNNNGNNGNNGSNKTNSQTDNHINTEPKPEKDTKLLIALIMLNITSGFTTMYGAAQILPWYVGWSSGAVIQALLFLLTSGSTLKHARWLKWMAVGSFSIISVYTSFFAYYDTLVSETREKDGLNRAISAHQNLVNEIFTPIEEKAQQLEDEIRAKNQEIENEVGGTGGSFNPGEGPIFKQRIREKNQLQIRLNGVKRVANQLRPFFEYELEGKEPQEIFDAGRKALAEVKPKCLPTEPEFVCLPEKYKGSLDPLNPKYKELQAKYFDQDARVRIIEPFLKIGKGEEAGIASAFMALLVDGCIILLGIGIEIPPTSKPKNTAKKTPKTITLPIEGTGTEFLDKLFQAINFNDAENDAEIDNKLFQENQKNNTQYQKLLQRLSNETEWIAKNQNNQWVINDEKKFTDWVIKEGERLIKNQQENNSDNITFYLPDDDTTEL
ncbi:hypothetical protein [Okeania sp. SIO2B3]|uniref:hypothetical protein n=1 Tax=Okeania sp. SIO2B3 TaxID=2607784 RepID=UPI0013C215DA|nr:hypothetical protein [Okeania sp. SIO2B3]NET41854.1 hypothetical protein [Okeania sp. SIO2B3]